LFYDKRSGSEVSDWERGMARVTYGSNSAGFQDAVYDLNSCAEALGQPNRCGSDYSRSQDPVFQLEEANRMIHYAAALGGYALGFVDREFPGIEGDSIEEIREVLSRIDLAGQSIPWYSALDLRERPQQSIYENPYVTVSLQARTGIFRHYPNIKDTPWDIVEENLSPPTGEIEGRPEQVYRDCLDSHPEVGRRLRDRMGWSLPGDFQYGDKVFAEALRRSADLVGVEKLSDPELTDWAFRS
jgi:hypothetical protein